MFFDKKRERADLARAKAIVGLEETEGWGHYKARLKELIETNTPKVSAFSQEEATVIASRLSYVSGIKLALDLIEQQKEIYKSLKHLEKE